MSDASTAADEFPEHIVAFVDMLGFANAVMSGEGATHIVQLLRSLKEISGDFWIETKKMDDGSARSLVRPAVTAFSDSIVISYPIQAGGIEIVTAILFMQKLIGFVAWNALEVGLLIRGGIAIGPLYHHDGVVVGPAMIEAYRLESAVAVYPRVVLNPNVSERAGVTSTAGLVTFDQDGLAVLDYMRGAVLRLRPAQNFNVQEIVPWAVRLRELTAKNIANYRAAGDLARELKWRRFASDLEYRIARLPPGLTVGEHRLP